MLTTYHYDICIANFSGVLNVSIFLQVPQEVILFKDHKQRNRWCEFCYNPFQLGNNYETNSIINTRGTQNLPLIITTV